MVKEKVILAGLELTNSKKWYCNNIDEDVAKCCDIYEENGSHIQVIGRYILTGEEEWKYNPISKSYYFLADNKYYDEVDGGRFDPMLCSHFKWSSDIENLPLYMFSGGMKNEIQFNFDNGVAGIENFLNWIKEQLKKGVPVQVQYILLYPHYYEPDLHKRTTKQVMSELNESLKNFTKK